MSRYRSSDFPKDLNSLLLEDRVINLFGPVDDALAYQVVSALQAMDYDPENSGKPIKMFINSPGGSVHAGLAIIDTMNTIESPVYTHVIGLAASMGAAILSAGEPGFRAAYPNSTIMLHQVSGGEQGNIQDMRVGFKFTEELNKRLLATIAVNCGKMTKEEYKLLIDPPSTKTGKAAAAYTSAEKKFKAFEAENSRDNWMFAPEAKKYGIVDVVVEEDNTK